MKFCDHCLAPLSQNATHCPECGLPVTSGTDDPLLIAEEERLVNPRLAHANLLRMRGQLEEAMRVCAEVLRQFPGNVHAHALMGDIHRDQGNLEEAAQWYKLALDLAPDSAVDRRRLEQVQQELELRQKAQSQSREVEHLQKQARALRIFSASVLGVAVLIAIGITWAFPAPAIASRCLRFGEHHHLAVAGGNLRCHHVACTAERQRHYTCRSSRTTCCLW
jgi:tetratricopeptide (TPR) repeat protein